MERIQPRAIVLQRTWQSVSINIQMVSDISIPKNTIVRQSTVGRNFIRTATAIATGLCEHTQTHTFEILYTQQYSRGTIKTHFHGIAIAIAIYSCEIQIYIVVFDRFTENHMNCCTILHIHKQFSWLAITSKISITEILPKVRIPTCSKFSKHISGINN